METIITAMITVLIPFISLWIKVGKWKGDMEQKIEHTQNSVITLNHSLVEMNNRFIEISNKLSVISAQVELLISNKIVRE